MTLYSRVSERDKRELIKRCREKEADGWIPIKPMHQDYYSQKSFNLNFGDRATRKKHRFTGYEDSMNWVVVYKKEDNRKGGE